MAQHQTQSLDTPPLIWRLQGDGDSKPECRKLLADAVLLSSSIIVIAGAGISTSAGVSDFRSPSGLFAQSLGGKQIFDAAYIASSPDRFTEFMAMMGDLYVVCRDAKPTKFHDLLSACAKDNALLRLYTQNIDGLDVRDPHLRDKTVQLHGDINMMVCTKCGDTLPTSSQTQFLERPPVPIPCPSCPTRNAERSVRSKYGLRQQNDTGNLIPRVTLYNSPQVYDANDTADIIRQDVVRRIDAVIVAGTKLSPDVEGVMDLYRRLRHDDRQYIWINTEPPPKRLENDFALVVIGEADEVADVLFQMARDMQFEFKGIVGWEFSRTDTNTVDFHVDWSSHHGRRYRYSCISEAQLQMDQPQAVLDFWTENGGRDKTLRQRARPGMDLLYHALRIVRHRRDGKRRQYLVQWVGYSDQPPDVTWESASKVRASAPGLVDDYEKKVNGD